MTLFKKTIGDDILLVQVYVDDIIFGSSNESLCASPIFYAVTKDLVIDQQHIRDFWESATYNLNANPAEIRARIMGEEIVLTVDSIAWMLRLERDVGIPALLSLTDVYEGFLEMRYEGTDYLERREIKKTFLSREWRFIAHVIIIFIDELKPDLQKLGDPLKLTKMNVRIFADCSAPRHDITGKITYLFRNMYTGERWEYIEKLKVSEEKQFGELREKIKDDIRKHKKFVGKISVPFEEQLDEIEAEIAKSKGKKKRKAADKSQVDSDTDVRIKRAKGKEPEVSQSVPKTFIKKSEKTGFAGLDEDGIRNGGPEADCVRPTGADKEVADRVE
ncbi:hypothetical protein QVD17_08961 [Tagetes erecta]|uniref:Reverse transcriptase Ty1/copia-type domain-containing protein n=1 Tax=Tagetes erecta TaxID=13708 RepID=A0AAD8L3D2_TARER|nr:hypothetical protein QVD17_08961 [Tagetes erecta]